jgi:hypothetical protein
MSNQKAYNSYRGKNNFQPPCSNEEEWLEWLKLNPRDLRRLPESLYSDKLFLSIVKHNGFAIGGVPFNYLSPKILITAIKREPMALSNIHEPLRTKKLCQIALEGDLKAIRFVPDEFIGEFARDVLSIDGKQCRTIIDKVSPELLELAVKTTPSAIQYIPSHLITPSMAFNALRIDGEVIQYIPQQLLSTELIHLALSNDRFGFVFECLPEDFKVKFKDFKKEISI